MVQSSTCVRADRASAKLEAMDLPIILTAGDDGYLVAQCPVISGCISQGRTLDEALANIQETIELCLENRDDER
jgi:predicted RNase H-like HicB family nuclease